MYYISYTNDEDCPELTAEQLSRFRRVHYENQILRRKEVISFRVLPLTIKKAKALGQVIKTF